MDFFKNTCVAKCATGETPDPATGASGEGADIANGRVM